MSTRPSNPISDISLLKGLTNLKGLVLERTLVSDLSPLNGLTNLEALWMDDTSVSDLSPLARLINLKTLTFSYQGLSDISPLAGLVNLKEVFSWDHSISDLSPLAGLTKLEKIDFCGGDISDLTPLAGLTGLKELYLGGEEVSDVSPIAGLTNLKWLRISDNDISDVSPIARLTNLTWLAVDRNNISDLSPLEGLREKIKLIWSGNPGIPKGGPKIEGPWLWVVLPGTEEHDLNEIDWLSEVSGGEVTEVGVATHGATAGKSVGGSVGKKVPAGSPVDVNGDGVVTTLDLLLVSQAIGNTTASAAPPLIPPQAGGEERVDPATIEAWIAQARLEDDGSLAFKQGIENLEKLLASLIPEETALLRNYPNPFNPETWIPYQLATPAEVTLAIYDMNGQLVRRLAVGHRAAGMYRSRSRAVYWDGRNQLGESVASGVYFYTLTVRSETRAGEFTATRRMLILK